VPLPFAFKIPFIVPAPPFAAGRTPVTPVVKGKPVTFVATIAEGVPNAGVTNVGEVAKTNKPVPVSSVIAVLRLAEDGVSSAVATPVPKPETPEEIGSPVALVRVPLAGVPSVGVVITGAVSVLFVSVCVPVNVTTAGSSVNVISLSLFPASSAVVIAMPDEPIRFNRARCVRFDPESVLMVW
jgi:hypothetical protein